MEKGYVSALLSAGQTDPRRWPSYLRCTWVAPSNCFLPPLACPRWLLALSMLCSGFIHGLVVIQDQMGVEWMFDGWLLPWANHHLSLVWVRGILPLSWDTAHARLCDAVGLLPLTSQSNWICRNLPGMIFPKHELTPTLPPRVHVHGLLQPCFIYTCQPRVPHPSGR